VAAKDPWQAQREALGAFIRSQRRMANLSLRQLAELTHGPVNGQPLVLHCPHPATTRQKPSSN
jgi:hypothetical protein